jgi:hypothetical protein
MKLAVLSGAVAICAAVVVGAQQAPPTPSDEIITLRGCLKGDGSKQNPWMLTNVLLPPPPPPPGSVPAPGRGGPGRGDAGGRGRGGPPPPPPPPPPQPRVTLNLSGVDFTPWRGMMVSADGQLMAKVGNEPQEFHAVNAHSAYGTCPQ